MSHSGSCGTTRADALHTCAVVGGQLTLMPVVGRVIVPGGVLVNVATAVAHREVFGAEAGAEGPMPTSARARDTHYATATATV
jgi:hypothetical protein